MLVFARSYGLTGLVRISLKVTVMVLLLKLFFVFGCYKKWDSKFGAFVYNQSIERNEMTNELSS